jgi:amino acid transporter
MAFNYVEPNNLIWTISPTFENIGSASLLLFFAFLGFEIPLANGAEIKNPQRTVPLGLLSGIIIIVILYVSIQLISQGVLGQDLNATNKTPLADVSGIVFGKSGIILMIIVTAISMFGALSCDILSVPRVLYAGAKKGFMPSKLAEIHPKFITPHYAIYFYAGVGFLLSISGSFKQLAILSSASILILYLGVVLATLKLRKMEPNMSEKTFKVPGGILIPALASLGILWFLSNLTMMEILSFVAFIGILSLIYILKIRPIKK